jgi:hypothetical protein
MKSCALWMPPLLLTPPRQLPQTHSKAYRRRRGKR